MALIVLIKRLMRNVCMIFLDLIMANTLLFQLPLLPLNLTRTDCNGLWDAFNVLYLIDFI